MENQESPTKSPNESTSSISDSTLLKLAESMRQQSASLLTSISIPEYHGTVSESFEKWLREFKQSTLTFNDQLRCLALRKALFGAARNWIKSDFDAKVAIEAGEWQTIKALLKNRWLNPNSEEMSHERLSRLKFDSKKDFLTSYIELYYNTYKKAHKGAKDSDIILALKINLPKDMIRHLNSIRDNWSESRDISEIYQLARKVESNILPYVEEDTNSEKTDFNAIVASIKELKDTMAKSAKETEAVIAAIRHEETRNSNTYNPNRKDHNEESFKKPQRDSIRPRARPFGAANRQIPYEYRRQRYGDESAQAGGPHSRRNDGASQLQIAYWEKHGKPPGPCHICGEGYHFNRHCPFKETLN